MGKENTVSLLEKIVSETVVVDFIGAVGSLAFRKVISVEILQIYQVFFWKSNGLLIKDDRVPCCNGACWCECCHGSHFSGVTFFETV